MSLGQCQNEFSEKVKNLTTYIKIFEKHILFILDTVIKHPNKSAPPFRNEMDYTETQFKVIIKNTIRLLCHLRLVFLL